MIAAAFDEAEARDPQHRRCWVVLVDGAAHQLKLIQKEADRRAVTVHIVLDIVHVIEKLWASAQCFHTATDPAAETWAGFKTARILADDASGAVRDLRSEAARGHLTDEQRATIDKTCHYLANHAAFVHYDQPSKPAGPSPAASPKEPHATWWPTASTSPAADAASPEPKPSPNSTRPSATATSPPTGAVTCVMNTHVSVPASTRPITA